MRVFPYVVMRNYVSVYPLIPDYFYAGKVVSNKSSLKQFDGQIGLIATNGAF